MKSNMTNAGLFVALCAAASETTQAGNNAPAAPGSKEANAPGADNARGTQHTDPTGRIMPVTLGNFLAEGSADQPRFRGMVLSHARKDPSRITGVVLVKKKDFVKAQMETVEKLAKAGEIDPFTGKPAVVITRSEADRRFEAYRQATYRQFSKEQGQALIEGRVNVDGVKFNPKGEAFAFSIVKAGLQTKDEVRQAHVVIAQREGVPEDVLAKMIADYKSAHPTTDVQTSPVQAALEVAATEIKANPEAGTTAPQSVPAGQ
jgi:hypothetical protein